MEYKYWYFTLHNDFEFTYIANGHLACRISDLSARVKYCHGTICYLQQIHTAENISFIRFALYICTRKQSV